MPTIELILRDENGQIMRQPCVKKYPLDWKSQSFHDIEGAVENFKQIALPDIEASLLEAAQDAFIQDKKKDLICNGKTPVTIKTLHGQFKFKVQRFIISQPKQENRTYFDLTDQFNKIYVSPRLQELAGYYSNRLSYSNVADLVERVTGDRQLSDQKIWEIARDKAIEISQAWQDEVEKTLNDPALSFPKIEEKINLYDSESREILVFEDAIQVRGQKENRLHKHKDSEEQPAQPTEIKKKSPPVFTHLVMLQSKDQGFEYIVAPINKQGKETVSLPDILKSRVIEEYGSELEPLPVVAITDGAQIIRQHLYAIFGITLVIILDWYHLGKKVRDLMSMIARNKKEKNCHLKFIFYHLWRGEVGAVLDYLETKVEPKNEEKHRELMGYLEKHRNEIIDYKRRKKAGKMIGSGYIEKGCDQVVGHRQKKKGMSWRETGSRSLGILKVAELNHQWEQFWFPIEAANDSANLRLASNS
jgi:hypothetical protein